MGAGASAGAGSPPKPSTQMCWEVSEMTGRNASLNRLGIPSPVLLKITQESLDFESTNHSVNKVLHFPYHQIKCWSSTGTYFSFQLGIEEIQNVFKLKTTEGLKIQKILLDTILKFMEQSKSNALQSSDFKVVKGLLFGEKNTLDADWRAISDSYFSSRPYRLTAAMALELLGLIDLSDEFMSLDFCVMLHEYIMNVESFKMVMNSITDMQLKRNLANRLGIDVLYEGITVKAPESPVKKIDNNNENA